MTLYVFNRDPESDETGLPISTNVSLDVSATGGDTVDVSQTKVWIEGALAFDAGVFQTNFDGPGSTAGFVLADTYRITIDPTSDFESEQVVDVRVVSESGTSSETLDESWWFEVEDLSAPLIDAVRGIALDEIEVTFDEAVDPDTALEAANYTIARVLDPELVIPSVEVEVESVSATLDPSVVVLKTNISTSHGRPYTLTIENVEDEHGNVIASPNNTASFDGFTPAIPDGRTFEVWRMFAELNRREDETRDLERFALVLQEVIDQLLFSIDEWTQILDVDIAPEQFVDAMLADLGNPFSFVLTLVDKRRLARVLVEIYRQKGTSKGIRNVIRFFLGLEVTITPFNDESGWILGDSELGIDTELGIGDIAGLYTFDVETTVNLTDEQRTRVFAIIDYMKPAHTHLGQLVEPEIPEVFDHWELGESELSEETILH